MNVSDMTLMLADALLRSQFLPGAEEDSLSAAGRRPVRKASLFTVTISREVGALGTAVGHEIGQRLEWPVYDQEIINKIAEEMGKPSTHVRGVDEKHFNWLEECLAGLLSDYHVNPTSYLKHLIGTVRALGLKGKCVIVGRGANFILPPETTLRVRLIAELKDRIKVIGRLRGISDAEAARWIEKTENDRVRFVQATFGKDLANPLHYDLVLNTSRLSAAECADTVINTLHGMMKRNEAAAREETLPFSKMAVERAGSLAVK
jgi:cytidylate kinase